MSNRLHRPTFLGIHARDASTQVLYISSGVRQAIGYTPEQLVSKSAHDYIADPYKDNFPSIYESGEQEDEEADDEANAYV
ncbi:hypothetical protein LPJ59_007228, partial [Coemansia sp. RSA 2399]